jgi:RecA-family ATPase
MAPPCLRSCARPGSWLLRKAAGLVFAPAGVGKSTFVSQASTLWSLGHPAFGIKPSKPLRILCFQAEDDDLDIREIAAGVKKLLNLSPDQCQQVSDKVKFVRTRRSGIQFFEDIVLPAIMAFRPDLIVINPLMAYAEFDMLKQDQAAGFFRRVVGGILESFNIGAIMIHHTPKPGNTDVTKLNPYQEQYLAFGSSDLINWVRATMMIWPTGVEGVFEFRAGKRREKVGWQLGEHMTWKRKLLVKKRDGHGQNSMRGDFQLAIGQIEVCNTL